MRFDLPLTAFALESCGAAARALGVCRTLTLPSQAPHDADPDAGPRLTLATEADGEQVAPLREVPATLTITF